MTRGNVIFVLIVFALAVAWLYIITFGISGVIEPR